MRAKVGDSLLSEDTKVECKDPSAEIPDKCHKIGADATKHLNNKCCGERDWLIQTSIGTCVPASPCGQKAPSPSAGSKCPYVSPDDHCPIPPIPSGAEQQLWVLFPRGLGQGASMLLTPTVLALPPSSPFTPSPSPGGLSHLPDEVLPTLISPACAPRALWLAPFSMAHGTTSSSQPPAAGRHGFSYLLSKIVGSSGLGHL